MQKRILPALRALEKPNLLYGLWLVHSDDELVLQWLIDSCRQSWQTHGQLIRRIELTSIQNWQDVLLQINSLSLFSENYAIIITGKHKPNDEILTALEQFAQQSSSTQLTHHIIWLLPKQDKKSQNTKAFRLFNNMGVVIDANIYNEKDRKELLEYQAKRFLLDLSHQAWQILLSHTEHDLLSAYQNLWRLSYLYDNQKNHTIKIDTPELMNILTDGGHFNVFNLSDALLSNNPKKCLKIIQYLKQTDITPSVVLWAISKDARIVAALQAGKSPEDLGIWQSKRSSYVQLSKKLSPQITSDLFQKIYQIDCCIKGVVDKDAWILIQELCLIICQTPCFKHSS